VWWTFFDLFLLFRLNVELDEKKFDVKIARIGESNLILNELFECSLKD
tara:strand:- start:102 stop:245 length:144 start_codon:yes stop_codon:yes gene_type:complete